MPLLANHLPPIEGPYPVSTIDVEHNLETPRLLSPLLRYRYPTDPAHPHPFQLDTVLFSIFYPCENAGTKVKRKAKHPWVPRPMSLQANGYARAAHMSNFVTDRVFKYALGGLAGRISISAPIDQPLISPHPSSASTSSSTSRSTSATTNTASTASKNDPQSDSDHLSTLPVLVFTHGMASTRTNYSHLLATLASHGYIVVALEHRDGSGPGSVVMPSSSPAYKVPLINEHDIIRVLDRDITLSVSVDDFKEAELEFREAEIEETVRILSLLNKGEGASIAASNPRKEGTTALPTFASRIDLSRAVILGHSFGAVAAMKVMKDCPVNGFKGGIAYDPGKESGPLNSEIDVPLLVVNSQSWSRNFSLFFGKPHFDVVRQIAEGVGGGRNVEGKEEKEQEKGREGDEKLAQKGHGNKTAAWFITCMGTSHASITDAPLIAPTILRWATGSTVDGRDGVHQYVDITLDYLRWLFSSQAPRSENDHRNMGLDRQVDEKETSRSKDVLKDSILGEGVSHYSYDSDQRDEATRRKWEGKGWEGKWQVHVAP